MKELINLYSVQQKIIPGKSERDLPTSERENSWRVAYGSSLHQRSMFVPQYCKC